jgi:hypothetical protein
MGAGAVGGTRGFGDGDVRGDQGKDGREEEEQKKKERIKKIANRWVVRDLRAFFQDLF